MRLCIWTLCTCLAMTVFGGPVKMGDSKETVIGALGQPMGMVKKGEMEILLFAAGEVELRNGRVDRMTVPPGEDIPPATPAQTRPQSGLTLRYAFDETGAVINDHSGHGRSANVHGALPSAQGKHHGAYEFNGRDAYIQTASPIDLAPPYTLTAWVYLRSRLTDGGDFSFYRGRTIMERGDLNRSGAWDYIFNVNANGKLGFVTHSAFSRADMLQNPEDFPLNRWVFVAFTHEGLTGRLYQDGRLVRTSAQMHAGNNHKGPGTFIGKVFNSHPASHGDHFWDGRIDELRIYNKALSAGELGEVQREAPPAIVGPTVAEPSPPSTLQPVTPAADRPASRPAPVRAELKAGELNVTLLKSIGGQPHVGVDIAMSPPYPGARQLVAKTDAAGFVKFQVEDGSYLVFIGGQVVGPIDVSRSSPWAACTVVFPEDYPNPPVGRPDLRPTIVGDALVLVAEQVPQAKQPPR